MDNLLSIKAYASREAVPIMQDEGCDFICDYIKEHKCKNILEIGTAIGYSSIRFAKLADDIKVTTIELDIDRHLKAVENFKTAGLDERITAIHGDALTYPLDGLFDLIFIDAAKAQYNQAVAGARSEDKAAANALVLQAKGATAEVDAYLEETKIRTPITGEVSLKLAEEGEVVGSGMPIIAVTDLSDSWAVFHLREDYLKNVYKGKKFYLQIPALDKTVEMVVSYIASVGDYATWRSSKESSGFDLKTFEVRMRPTHKVVNLRPGMSVLLPVDDIQ